MGDTQLAIYGTRASFKTSLSSLKSDVLTYGKRGDRCRALFLGLFWGGMNVPDIFSPPSANLNFQFSPKLSREMTVTMTTMADRMADLSPSCSSPPAAAG